MFCAPQKSILTVQVRKETQENGPGAPQSSAADPVQLELERLERGGTGPSQYVIGNTDATDAQLAVARALHGHQGTHHLGTQPVHCVLR